MIELPSKKFIRIFTAIAIVLILVFSASYFSEKRSNKTKLSKNNATEKEAFIANLLKEEDADNDGLKDWEEILWGTDPNNPDSDGDGTKDGEEVTNDRNPLISGPDDKINSDKTLSNSNLFNKNNSGLTKTDILSRELFKSVLAMQKSGNMDEQSINDASAYFVQEILKDNKDKKPDYVYSDLKIINKNDNETIKIYGNKLGDIILEYYHNTKNNTELDIVKKILNKQYNKNTKKIIELDKFIKYYQDAVSKLLKITVPKDIAELHLETINSLNSIAQSLKIIQFFYKDPLVGMTGIIKYQKETAKLTELSQLLRIYMIKNKIKFTEKDAGYIFIMN